jgi:glycine dehydrogenase subunit 1
VRFLPHTADDIRSMLEVVGVASTDELFEAVPAALRQRAHLDLPPGLSELEVRERLEALARRNADVAATSFVGGGAYAHFVPAIVDQVLQRAEFYSAYTPYQPEVSQGTLQAVYEFQTLVALLLGLDVANASMYDGASATAEAALMALRMHSKRKRIVLSQALHPQYRAVVQTYSQGAGSIELIEAPIGSDGRADLDWLAAHLDEQTAAVIVGYPNVFGVIEKLDDLAALAHTHGASLITATAEAMALGLLKSPGSHGVDIAVAEGQSLGIPISYGGPGVGLFATRTESVRSMPGRLVGEAVDGSGRRGYVLTLATREQHIRREKATSNICTNHGLMALALTVYLSVVGPHGLRDLAVTNTATAHRLAARLTQSGRWRLRFAAPFFNEFVVEGTDARAAWERARARGVLAGMPLGEWYPDLADSLLLCATEVHDDAAIQQLAEALGC